MVERPARRADHQLRAVLEGLDLRLVPHAAVHERRLQAVGVRRGDLHLLELLVDLPRKLAGGREDENLLLFLVRVHQVEERKQERPRLARARLRLHDQVPLLQRIRDGLALHGHQLGPARGAHRLLHPPGEAVDGHLIEGRIGFVEAAVNLVAAALLLRLRGQVDDVGVRALRNVGSHVRGIWISSITYNGRGPTPPGLSGGPNGHLSTGATVH